MGKRFPERFGPDVTVADIDLDAEEFVVGGDRLTEERAHGLARELERSAGRPSLSGPGRRSPALNVRIPERMRARLADVAHSQGRRQSDVVREALDAYFDRLGA